MRKAIMIISGIFFSFLLMLVFFSYPWSINGKTSEGQVSVVEPKVDWATWEESPSVIKLLTWNLGFLYGDGSEGPGYEHRDKAFYEERLSKFASEIRNWGPDIVFLQEIDFDSSRSGGINQAEYLALHGGYPYIAQVSSWVANYIPFPYWPITRNFGRMNSGGAILSRFPIKNHHYELLTKPDSNPWWYNLFYLHRYFQTVTVEIGTQEFKFTNLHLEAFDKSARNKEIAKLVKKIKEEKIDFVLGDFNMVPDSAAKKRNFPQSDDEYENDNSFSLMGTTGLSEVIPEEIYSKDESRYFTFPASRPNRRLDYIFFRRGLKMMRAEVLPSALSDHLPIKASFQISGPNFNPYQQ